MSSWDQTILRFVLSSSIHIISIHPMWKFSSFPWYFSRGLSILSYLISVKWRSNQSTLCIKFIYQSILCYVHVCVQLILNWRALVHPCMYGCIYIYIYIAICMKKQMAYLIEMIRMRVFLSCMINSKGSKVFRIIFNLKTLVYLMSNYQYI